MITIPSIKLAANLAQSLHSPDCINWEHLETMYAMKGKDHLLKVLNEEKDGANNILLAHISLAETAIMDLD
jgi:hypothetical protein